MFQDLKNEELMMVSGGDAEQDWYNIGYEIGNAIHFITKAFDHVLRAPYKTFNMKFQLPL